MCTIFGVQYVCAHAQICPNVHFSSKQTITTALGLPVTWRAVG